MAHGYNTLVVGNGDVESHEDGIQKATENNMDGVMVGRAIFHDPYLFNPDSRNKDPIGLLKLHLSEYQKLWGDTRYDPMKRFFKVYIHDKDLRLKLMQTKSISESLEIINSLHNFSGVLK